MKNPKKNQSKETPKRYKINILAWSSSSLVWFGILAFGAFLPSIMDVIPAEDSVRKKLNPWVNPVSQIIVGTFASVLAASLIENLVLNRELKEKQKKQETLRVLFGDDLEAGRTAIVLPRFDSKTLEVKIVGTDIQTDELAFLSFSDTQAAIEIISMFEESGLSRPELIFDNSKINTKEYETLFVIGLCSNHLFVGNSSEGLDLSRKDNILKVVVSDPPVGHFELKRSSDRNRMLYQDPPDTQNQGDRYGTIVKMKIVVDKHWTNIIVVGGISADITTKCGKYLRQNIESLAAYRDEINNNKELGSNEFAILLKYSKSDELVAVEKYVY